MQLVQLLLPLTDPDGKPFPKSVYGDLALRLTDEFGGVTAYSRSASGLWESDSGHAERDQLIVYEVMVEQLDRTWWATLRTHLEVALSQQELVIRALDMTRL